MIESLRTSTLPSPDYYTPRRRRPSARVVLAALLRAANLGLAKLSRRLRAADRAIIRPPSEMVFEFYAEAGAPEGALYVDGELIGYLPGITRL